MTGRGECLADRVAGMAEGKVYSGVKEFYITVNTDGCEFQRVLSVQC